MAESFIDEIVRYVQFGREHMEALRGLHDHAAASFPAMADRFYQRLADHPQARAVFQSEEQVDRLKISLRNWFGTLLTGPWDESYFQQRARIGRAHVKVGLPQRYMLTAMNQIRDMLHEIAAASYPDREVVCRVVAAVDKVCDVELAIMLETYREDSLEAVTRVQRLERDVLQRRLQITEARYQAIVETAEVLVIAADPDGHVVLFNRQAEATTGLERTAVAGLDVLEELFEQADFQRFRTALDSAVAGESPPPFRGRLFSRSGSERWVRWHVTTLASAGEPYVCAIGIDHTDEHLLAEQTRRAERLASLGTLAAGLAHEIRNPLNAAQLQLLLVERRLAKMQEESAPAVIKTARVVKGELVRLGVLVEDFLAFARPNRLRLASGDLEVTAETIIALMKPDAHQCGVELRFERGQGVAARYDEERIRQVLLNLIRNGVEAAGEGGWVDVQVLRARNRAIIEIRDSGEGPPQGLDLFQPFRTSKESGTGLGLSIVHRIVTDHDGKIEHFRDGHQTCFRVEVPVDGPVSDREPARA